jgi:hypothetical protein
LRTSIDTNVLSMLWDGGPQAEELAGLLGALRREGPLVVCGPVYVELCAHPKASREFVEGYLEERRIVMDLELDLEDWRAAAEAYAGYAMRRRSSGGGQAKRVMADFLIAAHAVRRAERLLTLDRERYAAAFPSLRLIP